MTSERARLMQSDVKNLTDVDSSRLQVLDFYLDPANINKKEVTDMIDKTIAETRSAIVGFAFQDITTHLLLDKHDAADDVISQAYKDVKGVGLFTFSDGSYNMAAELTKQLPRFALDMVIISGLEFFTFGGGTPAVAAYASTKYARLFGKVGTEFIETFRRSAKLRKFVAA